MKTMTGRPTANCIWNVFLSSGKRHLILTGTRGAGKTTLLSKLCPEPLPGITTWAQPHSGVYLKENRTGEIAQIGVYNGALPGVEHKMTPLPEGFSSLGIPALERCQQEESEWITIDELGYLESGHIAYQDAVRRLMEKKRMIAVVRKQDIPFLQELCSRADTFVVDLDIYGTDDGGLISLGFN